MQQEKPGCAAEKTKRYAFFQHTDCEFFPCHPTDAPEAFNCLFCYCPLYTLGEACGGNYAYTDAGRKDCSHCLLPHGRDSAAYIASRYDELMRLAAKRSQATDRRKGEPEQ